MESFIKQLNSLEKAMRVIPAKMGAEAVRFSKQRFQEKNWIDNSSKGWKKRKVNKGSKRRKKRGVLTDTGRLRRSIKKLSATSTRIVIGTDVPYAQVHNDGWKGTVNIPKHTRGRYKKSKEGTGSFSIRTRKEGMRTVKNRTGDIEVKAHKKRMNMPQRKFLGNSAFLAKRIERIAAAEFSRALK